MKTTTCRHRPFHTVPLYSDIFHNINSFNQDKTIERSSLNSKSSRETSFFFNCGFSPSKQMFSKVLSLSNLIQLRKDEEHIGQIIILKTTKANKTISNIEDLIMNIIFHL